jgi:hypothetical protein
MRRAKESLVVIVVGAVFVWFASPLPAGALTQNNKGGTKVGAQHQTKGGGKTSAKRDRGGGRPDAAADTNRSSQQASETPATTSTPNAETGAGADPGAANQQPDGTPTNAPSPGATAENANQPANAAHVASAATSSAVPWGIVVGGFTLGLLALALAVGNTLILGRRLGRIENEIKEVKQIEDKTSSDSPSYTFGHTVSPRTSAEGDSPLDQRIDDDAPTAEEGKETLPHAYAIIVDKVDGLTEKVKKIEERLKSGARPQDDLIYDGDVKALGDGHEVPPAISPPQSVTVEKMVAWANGVRLRLEPVKATFGLFGNFSRSEEGDNWLISAGVDGESYLFPRVERFESDSHFEHRYSSYYNCDHPSAGMVVIDQPARVSSDPQGGWKLKDKGKLSVAS